MTKTQLNNIVMGVLFNMEDQHSQFEIWWNTKLSGQERIKFADCLTSELSRSLGTEEDVSL